MAKKVKKNTKIADLRRRIAFLSLKLYDTNVQKGYGGSIYVVRYPISLKNSIWVAPPKKIRVVRPTEKYFWPLKHYYFVHLAKIL